MYTYIYIAYTHMRILAYIPTFIYIGHSPNLDFFQVRPYFKEIAQGRRPKVIFEEYLDMPGDVNIFIYTIYMYIYIYVNICIYMYIYTYLNI
jgi:hypothetical protein